MSVCPVQMSEACVRLVPRLWASAPVVQPAGPLPPAVTEAGAERLAADSRRNRACYDALLDTLLSLMESGTL